MPISHVTYRRSNIVDSFNDFQEDGDIVVLSFPADNNVVAINSGNVCLQAINVPLSVDHSLPCCLVQCCPALYLEFGRSCM